MAGSSSSPDLSLKLRHIREGFERLAGSAVTGFDIEPRQEERHARESSEHKGAMGTVATSLEMLSSDQNNLEARKSLALAFETLGKMREAVAEWIEIGERAGDALSPRLEAASALCRLNEPELALKAWQAVVEMTTGNVENMERLAKLMSEDAETFAQLGELYCQSGRYHEALRTFERAAELDPNEPSYRANIGTISEFITKFGH